MSIYKKIPLVMAKLAAVPKAQKNIEQNYMFRGIDEVMNACHKIFAECGVFIVPTVIKKERIVVGTTQKGMPIVDTNVTVCYRFCADDGTFIEAVGEGEARDYADKGTKKAMTSAFKTILEEVFCFSTQDTTDTEKDNPEPAAVKPKRDLTLIEKLQVIPATLQKAKTPETLNKFWDSVTKLELTADQRKTVFALFDKRASELEMKWNEDSGNFQA